MSSSKAQIVATPMWIPTPGGKCFAWYHRPSQGPRAGAVLLCDPFGWNRMVLHLTYRQLAVRLAEAGFAVLRIDYPGTCDSEGYPRECARVNSWLDCLDSGSDHLRRWSGATEISAFGALFGGTLAALLAARRTDVTGLALWAAYAQGSVMTRTEMAATATRPGAIPNRSAGLAEGDVEALGFLLPAPMVAELRDTDILSVRLPRVRRSLLLARASGTADRKLAQHFEAQGIEVDLRTPPEDIDAVLRQNGAGCPSSTIEAVVDWHDKWTPGGTSVAALDLDEPARSYGQVEFRDADVGIRESAVFFGAGEAIFGILSEPVGTEPQSVGVLLVNGGHNHRSGINRNYTEWARRLSRQGCRVLRMDVRGLGDSAPGHPDGLGKIYTEEATRNVLDAVAWLKARGSREVCCIGLCAGGYQAFQAALADPSITSIVMLNPLRFHADRADARPAKGLAGVAERIARRLPRVVRGWGQAERRIARSFVRLAERGAEVLIVYNANERYREFLEGAVSTVRGKLRSSGRFRIEVLGPSDHIFSPLAAQIEVAGALERYIAHLARTFAPQHRSGDPRPVRSG